MAQASALVERSTGVRPGLCREPAAHPPPRYFTLERSERSDSEPSANSTASRLVLLILHRSAAAVGQIAHWIFPGATASRLNRSAAAWIAACVLLWPIGSVVALIVLWWYGTEQGWRPAAAFVQRGASGAGHEPSGS